MYHQKALDVATVSEAACKAVLLNGQPGSTPGWSTADSSTSRTRVFHTRKAGALPASVTGPIFYMVGNLLLKQQK